MKRDFKNKTAVISGAAGGIGWYLVEFILEKGGIVIAIDINEEALKKLKDKFVEFSERLFVYQVDITDFDKLKVVYKKIKDKFEKIDYLFNNAGAVHRSLFIDTDITVFHKIIAVNLWGTTYLTKLFLPDIISSKGAIAVTSSVAGFAPLYGRTFYCASKYALHGLFETLRTEVKSTGVDITIVSPGFTKTAFEQAALGSDGKRLTKKREKVGKYLTPDYVAESIICAVEKRKRFVVLSSVGKISFILKRFLPVVYDRLMYNSVKDEFNGK